MTWSGIALLSSLIISVQDMEVSFMEEELEGCCCLGVVLWYARAMETCTWSSANDKIPSHGNRKALFYHTKQFV